MRYFGSDATKAARVGYGILSVAKGIFLANDINARLNTRQNPIYWSLIAIDLTITADLFLTAYTGKVLPITTTLKKIPYGEKLLEKIENLYDFIFGKNESRNP